MTKPPFDLDLNLTESQNNPSSANDDNLDIEIVANHPTKPNTMDDAGGEDDDDFDLEVEDNRGWKKTLKNGVLITTGLGAAVILCVSASSHMGNNKTSSSAMKTIRRSGSKSSKGPKSSKSPKSTNAPSLQPSSSSCMSGDTGITKVNDDGTTTIVALRNAKEGDKVKGLDSKFNEAVCDVVAIGYWGTGTLFGNYTEDHYVLDTFNGTIVAHGQVGEETFGDKYVLLSTCPLVIDESGVAFTPIDEDEFPADELPDSLSWEYYQKVHKVLITTVSLIFIPREYQINTTTINPLVSTKNVYDAIFKCAEGGEDCLPAVDVLMGRSNVYSLPNKEKAMEVGRPLVALRHAGNEALIQQLFASMLN